MCKSREYSRFWWCTREDQERESIIRTARSYLVVSQSQMETITYASGSLFFTVLVKRKISSLFSHYIQNQRKRLERYLSMIKKPWNSNYWHFDIIMHVPFNWQFLRCYVKGFFFPCQMRDEMRLDFFFCPFFQDIQCTLWEALIVLTSTLDWFQIEAISSLCTSTPLLFSKSEWPKSSLFSIEVNIP